MSKLDIADWGTAEEAKAPAFEDILQRVHDNTIGVVNLRGYNLGDARAKQLISTLKHNRSVYNVDLNGNNLTESSALALADLMQGNHRIAALDIDNNDLSPDAYDSIENEILQTASKNFMRMGNMRERSDALYELGFPNDRLVGELAVEANHPKSITPDRIREMQARIPAMRYRMVEWKEGDKPTYFRGPEEVAASFGMPLDFSHYIPPLPRVAIADQASLDTFDGIGSLDDLRKVPVTKSLQHTATKWVGKVTRGNAPPPPLPPLYQAIQAGQFEEILALAEKTGKRLTAADYLLGSAPQPDGSYVPIPGQPTVIEMLMQQGYLAEVFKPERWDHVGDAPDMAMVASFVPPAYLEKQLGQRFGAVLEAVLANQERFVSQAEAMLAQPPVDVTLPPPPPIDPKPHADLTDTTLWAAAQPHALSYDADPMAHILTPEGDLVPYMQRLQWNARRDAEEIAALKAEVEALKGGDRSTDTTTLPRSDGGSWAKVIADRREAATMAPSHLRGSGG